MQDARLIVRLIPLRPPVARISWLRMKPGSGSKQNCQEPILRPLLESRRFARGKPRPRALLESQSRRIRARACWRPVCAFERWEIDARRTLESAPPLNFPKSYAL